MSYMFTLVSDLKDKITNAFKTMPFESQEGGKLVLPNVWIGEVLPKRTKTKDEPEPITDDKPPFVLIKTLNGNIGERAGKARGHTININFLLGIYNSDGYRLPQWGHHDLLNMIDTIIRVLNDNRVYGKFWAIDQDSINWITGLDSAESVYMQGKQETGFYGAVISCSFTQTFQQPRHPLTGA